MESKLDSETRKRNTLEYLLIESQRKEPVASYNKDQINSETRKKYYEVILRKKRQEEPVAFCEKVWIDPVINKLKVKYLSVDKMIYYYHHPNPHTKYNREVMEIDYENAIKDYKEKGEINLLVALNNDGYQYINLEIEKCKQSDDKLRVKELELCKKYLENWFDERGFEFKDGKYYAREEALVNKEPQSDVTIDATIKSKILEIQPAQTKTESEPIQLAQSESNEDRVARAKVKELTGKLRAAKKYLHYKYNLDPNQLAQLIDEARHPNTGKFRYRRLARLLGCNHTTAKDIVERNGLEHLTD